MSERLMPCDAVWWMERRVSEMLYWSKWAWFHGKFRSGQIQHHTALEILAFELNPMPDDYTPRRPGGGLAR